MIRVFILFVLLAVLAFGTGWLADVPGEMTLTWQGYQYRTSLFVALGLMFVALSALVLLLGLLGFVFRIRRGPRR